MKKLLFLPVFVLMLCSWTGTVFAMGEQDAVGKVPAQLSEYWTEGSVAAENLNAYMQAVTDEASPDYIPVEDRIAVFDLDGTLMCETYPFCFEYMVFSDYVLNHSDKMQDEVVAVAQEIADAAGKEKPDGMSTRQASAGAVAYQGMTMSEIAEMVRDFKGSEAWGFSGMTRGEAYYKPMVELFNALLENDFTVYVVTATERNIVRELINGTLDIPPSCVIGTEYGYRASGQGEEADGDYTFQPSDRIVFDGTYEGENAKTCKVDAIVREIGQQPVLAFGNSSGDLAMEIYTTSNNPYKSAAYMVVADDEEREYGDTAGAEEKKKTYAEQGIGIISMKDDFRTIYGDDVVKTNPDDPDDPNTDRETIFQVSLLQGLTLGDYNGSVSAAEIKEKGDIGIGTFDALDGELVMVDGVVYRAAGDGSVEAVPDEETIPFAAVTLFDADETQTLAEVADFDSLRAILDEKVRELGENRFYMILIDGTFSEMHARSEYAQEEPYKPLAKVMETDQTFFDFENMDGTVVGLYCPQFMKDLNVAGWHLHFVSDDRLSGGHVLGLGIDHAELAWDYTDGFRMLLPEGEMFTGLDLTVDQSEDIKKVETNE